jgi:hypothetical protein
MAWYWHKNRCKDQWNKIEDADINPHSYSQLIFDKGAENTWRKDSLFNKCCWKNWISTFRRLKLDPFLSPCTDINSKGIKDLNIRPETFKQLQEVVGNTLNQIGKSNDILSGMPIAQHLRERMNKQDCIKLKSFWQKKRQSLDLWDSPQNRRKSLPVINPIRD